MNEKLILIEQIKELLANCNDMEILYLVHNLLVKTSN